MLWSSAICSSHFPSSNGTSVAIPSALSSPQAMAYASFGEIVSGSTLIFPSAYETPLDAAMIMIPSSGRRGIWRQFVRIATHGAIEPQRRLVRIGVLVPRPLALRPVGDPRDLGFK